MWLYRDIAPLHFAEPSDDLREEDSVYCLTYPGEYVSDRLFRALTEGVSPEMTHDPEYDDAPGIDTENETSVYEVDVSTDIRTDRFALAESMALAHERRAAQIMTDAASARSGSAPAEQAPDSSASAVDTAGMSADKAD